MSNKDFRWYMSYDRESWTELRADNRWDAIIEGFMDNDDFYICQATHHEFPYGEMFDIEDINSRMIENDCGETWGEDQDSIFFKEPTREQVLELEHRLIATFKKWVVEYGIKLERPWCFDEIKDEEKIEYQNFCWVWTHYRGRIFKWWE